MADPLVEQADVEVALVRPLRPNEIDFIDGLCLQASNKLRGVVGNIDARIAAGALDASTVAAVLASVVARFLKNPDEASAVSETVGPVSKSSSWAGNRTTGLIVTDADIAQLNLSGDNGFIAAGTFHTAPTWPTSDGCY